MAKLKETSMSALLQHYCEKSLAVDEAIHKHFSGGVFGHYQFEHVSNWAWLRSLVEAVLIARTPEDHEEARDRLHESIIEWRQDYDRYPMDWMDQ